MPCLGKLKSLDISLKNKLMPITKSAKKALRGSKTKKEVNDKRKKTMKDTMKKVAKLAKEDPKKAREMLSVAYKAIDKAQKGGVIKKNNASRKKSRIAKIVKNGK